MKPTAYIHHWGYFPEPFAHLRGIISDHPRQGELAGPPHHTSQIVKMPMKLKPGAKVETLNTVYILGFNHQDYKKFTRRKKRENVTEDSKEG